MDIAISTTAWPVLNRLLSQFLVRDDAPALVYWSRFLEPDGTPVADFRPGYALTPRPMEYVDLQCGLVRFPGHRTLYLIPTTGWDAGIHYDMDLISSRYGVFSITPMG